MAAQVWSASESPAAGPKARDQVYKPIVWGGGHHLLPAITGCHIPTLVAARMGLHGRTSVVRVRVTGCRPGGPG